jgi:cytochrome c oxidase subunit 3
MSEVMFFAAIFTVYMYFAFGAALFGAGLWPPAGIAGAPAWPVPAVNTAILLTSGAATVFAHHSFLAGRKGGAEAGLVSAILLGILFLVLQIREFATSAFDYQDGIYPSTFFIGTGFHGLHVLIGIVLLSIALVRLSRGHFVREAHFGLEAPIWYWHFVDVVWLFLFAIFYIGWD